MSNTPALTPAQLRDVLNRRYAAKKLDPAKKIPADAWAVLEEALLLSPSSLGLQPWKFFIVTDASVRARLLPFSHGQTQVVDCSHLVVFARRKNITPEYIQQHIENTAKANNVPVEKYDGFKQMVTGAIQYYSGAGKLDAWAENQVHLALGLFVLSAATLGADTCPMGGIVPEKYDEILGIAGSDFTTVVACPCGYRLPDDKYASAPKVRFPATDLIVRV